MIDWPTWTPAALHATPLIAASLAAFYALAWPPYFDRFMDWVFRT
jgi:hypothetical protein